MPLREHMPDRIGTAIASANSGCSRHDSQLRVDEGVSGSDVVRLRSRAEHILSKNYFGERGFRQVITQRAGGRE
jgi:hypothetical protein